ncbi:MAG TPA: STAS domain-containing protein [Acidimicrobiales bacterium]|nr:STAS domain-containing protein [Acidimicrobiales bacterium]
MTINRAAVRCDRVGDHLTLFLTGELDCASAGELGTQVIPFILPTDERVRVDLSGVTFCGSAGLTLFVQLHNLVRDRGGELTFYAPPATVMRSIELCRLDELLTIARPLTV